MSIVEPDQQLNDHTKSHDIAQPVVDRSSILSALVGIKWNGQDCQFSDWITLSNINLWRDYLPAEIETSLPGMTTGEQITQTYAAGELIEDHSRFQTHQIRLSQFKPPKKGLVPIQPCLGRCYPRDFFSGVPDVYEGNKLPCRITALEGDQLNIDLNHALAGKTFDMIFRIDSIKPAGAERGGRCNDIPSAALDNGPGMQDRLPLAETDFWSENPFSRLDEGKDEDFYSQPSLTPFWDSAALQQVSQLYDELIKDGTRVLDLMAGAHSPLQESRVKPASVACAGLNAIELDHNPICSEAIKLDVNGIDALPFDDEQFDVVLIHAAIEYVTRPELLFNEIKRVLKPAGRVIISFSNRSLNEKVIQLWSGAHEFERPAIVLAYLRAANGFGHFNSYSSRGQLRPENDKLAHRLLYSDPVYAVWADKL